MIKECDSESVFDNLTDQELEQLVQDKKDAENAGVFDDDHIYDCVDGYAKKFTVEQEICCFRPLLFDEGDRFFIVRIAQDWGIDQWLKRLQSGKSGSLTWRIWLRHGARTRLRKLVL